MVGRSVLADEIGAPSRGVDDEPKAARRLSAGEWCGWYYAQDVGVVWSVCHCCSLIAIVIGSVMCLSFVRSGWLFWCCRWSQQEVVKRQERHAASQAALQVGVPMCGLAGIILVW